MDYKEKALGIIKHFHPEIEDISATDNLDDIGIDSVDLMGIVMAIEDSFGIEIYDEDLEPVVTVDCLLKLIEWRI